MLHLCILRTPYHFRELSLTVSSTGLDQSLQDCQRSLRQARGLRSVVTVGATSRVCHYPSSIDPCTRYSLNSAMVSVASMVTRYRDSAKLGCVSVFIFLALTWNFFHRSNESQSQNRNPKSEATSPSREPKRLVVASLKEEDTTWLAKRLPDWPVSRYVVDDPAANLTVPIEKGREAMVYLT
jgi:Protein of unknown function (DUF3431)